MEILDLNDDCLLEIFRYLDLKSLISVDQVCSKFNDTAQIIYRQFRHYEIHIRTEGNLSGDILARIGPHLDSLLFSCGYLIVPTTIIKNIVSNCHSLTRLKLQYITLNYQDMNLFKTVFENLVDLELSCVRVSDHSVPPPFMLIAPKLKRLRLHFVENYHTNYFISLVEDNPGLVIERFPV